MNFERSEMTETKNYYKNRNSSDKKKRRDIKKKLREECIPKT